MFEKIKEWVVYIEDVIRMGFEEIVMLFRLIKMGWRVMELEVVDMVVCWEFMSVG